MVILNGKQLQMQKLSVIVKIMVKLGKKLHQIEIQYQQLLLIVVILSCLKEMNQLIMVVPLVEQHVSLMLRVI